jgi:hypothetical protein
MSMLAKVWLVYQPIALSEFEPRVSGSYIGWKTIKDTEWKQTETASTKENARDVDSQRMGYPRYNSEAPYPPTCELHLYAPSFLI